MHGGTEGALISYKGHVLTTDEFHAFVYGLLGFVVTLSDEVSRTISKEPHYFLGGLALSYVVGKWLRSD